VNINLSELPTCKCSNGRLLPVQDVAKEGGVYLKGWFCTSCNMSWLFSSGGIISRKVELPLDTRGEK